VAAFLGSIFVYNNILSRSLTKNFSCWTRYWARAHLPDRGCYL